MKCLPLRVFLAIKAKVWSWINRNAIMYKYLSINMIFLKGVVTVVLNERPIHFTLRSKNNYPLLAKFIYFKGVQYII